MLYESGDSILNELLLGRFRHNLLFENDFKDNNDFFEEDNNDEYSNFLFK